MLSRHNSLKRKEIDTKIGNRGHTVAQKRGIRKVKVLCRNGGAMWSYVEQWCSKVKLGYVKV